MSNSSCYEPPDWAVAPPLSSSESNEDSGVGGGGDNDDGKGVFSWTLTEIKNGTEVGRYDLNGRSCWLIGRATDMVDIPSLHESLSRQHARIAFDRQGIPWLKDLMSTHGTKVNKRPLPNAAISKQETNSTAAGSRGVRLFPGDLIQFGASTRLYVIDGPPEYERGAVQAREQQAKQEQLDKVKNRQQQQQQQSTGLGKTDNGPGVTWGISMDDDHDDHEYDNHDRGRAVTDKKLPMDIQVPEKHQQSLGRLNALKYKLSNLQTEDDRIRRKGDLTEGQERQLQRNSEREQALERQIVELEEALYDKLYPSSSVETAGGQYRKNRQDKNNEVDDHDDDDDYYDRTKKDSGRHAASIGEDEAESEQSLTSKWKQMNDERKKKQNVDMARAQSKLSSLQQHLEKLEQTGDEEAFFVKNDVNLAKESLQKVQLSIELVEKAMSDAEKLLKVVNPKIQYDRITGYIGIGPPTPQIPSQSKILQDSKMLPPPIRRGVVESRALAETTSPAEVDADFGFIMPAPKKKRVLGPTMPPPSYRPPPDEYIEPSPGPTPGPTPAPTPNPSNPTRHHASDSDKNVDSIDPQNNFFPVIDEEMASTVVAGTALGRSLKRALLNIQQDDEKLIENTIIAPQTITVRAKNYPDLEGNHAAGDTNDLSDQSGTNQSKIVLDDDLSTRIMESFTRSAGSTSDETKKHAPRALIRGRCDYYNRFGSNWRVVMDHVELKRRPLPGEMASRKRFRKDRQSIWDRDEAVSKNGESVVLLTQDDGIEKLQLLGFGDGD